MNHPSAGSQSEPPIGSPILGPAVPPSADARLPLIIDEDLGPLTSSDYRRPLDPPRSVGAEEQFAAHRGSSESRDGGSDNGSAPEWLIQSEASERVAWPGGTSEADLSWEEPPQGDDLIGGGGIGSDEIIPVDTLLPNYDQEDQHLADSPDVEQMVDEPNFYQSEPSAPFDAEQSSADVELPSDDVVSGSEEGFDQEAAVWNPWRSDDDGIVSNDEPSEDIDDYATPVAAADPSVTSSLVLEEIASRLERIADSLRNRDCAAVGDGDDPLEVLITGYALGYSEGARRASEGQPDGI
ncbi:hypothetical protein BH23GEM6_BH23GEM6_04520 [soil metagenome]